MSPLLWMTIERVASRFKPEMSPADIVRELKKLNSAQFGRLAPQTLGRWIDRTGESPRWSDKTIARVQDGNRPGGVTTRVGVLVCTALYFYPQDVVFTEIHIQVAHLEVTQPFLEQLINLRALRLPLTLTTIRGLLIGHLEHFIPQIFTTPSLDGTLFRCSEAFVRKFVHRALSWTIRASTRAGRKVPSNADSILRSANLRIAYVIKHEDIPSELIANSDQTQVLLAQGSNVTYAPIGANQVATIGAEEKRAFTVLVTLTNDGILLPFQSIYKGSSAASLPAKETKSMAEAINAGFLFESSKTSTYWSTQETMRHFVDTVLGPHFEKVKVTMNLPHEQCSLWLIDCWSVHRSKEFLTWIGIYHSTIIVLFVPAGLTGLFQPCDVGFQRMFKHSLKLSSHDDIVQEVLGQLRRGVAVSDVAIDSTLKVLRNRTVHWLWVAFSSLNKPEIVKKVRVPCIIT